MGILRRTDSAPAPRAPRRAEFDLLRLLAAAGVVAIHTLAWYSTPPARLPGTPTGVTDSLLNAVCVPVFVFLTGMLVWGADSRPRDRRAWWARRMEVVFVPYLVWSAVYYAARPWLGAPLPPFGWALVEDFSVRLLSGGSGYHLYFPPILLLIYALTPLARRLAHVSAPTLVAVTLAAHGALAAVCALVPLHPELRRVLIRFALLVPYAAVGAHFAVLERRGRLPRRAVYPLAAAGLAVLTAQAFGLLPPQTFDLAGSLVPDALAIAATSAVLVALATALAGAGPLLEPHRARLSHAASLTYGVYLAHPLVLAVAARSLGASVPASARIGVMFAAVLAVTVTLVAALRSTPATEWIA